MNYNEFIAKFKEQVYALPPAKQLEFGVSVCKKLYFDYETFSVQYKWGNPDLLMDAVMLCEQARNGTPRKEQVETMLAKVEAITPDMDDLEVKSVPTDLMLVLQSTMP